MFTHTAMSKFDSTRKMIENDPNYQPHITNQELLNLVVDDKGCAKHTPRKSAIAIQRSPINASSSENESKSIGIVYQIKIAQKGWIDERDDYPIWHIDSSIVMLVNKKGEITFHTIEAAKMGNFNEPLPKTIKEFIGLECLHKAEKKEEKVIICSFPKQA